MVRIVPFVMALVTLGVTAGAHVPSSKAAADKADQGLRETRTLHHEPHHEPVRYCNFIGCPNGWAPIPNAHEVECHDDPCEVEQCCDLFCNSIGCPNGYTPIHNDHKVECYDDPCEPEQCCEAFCSYHPCPNGFVPVDGAAHILCPTSGCTDYLCCEPGGHH